MKAALIAVRDAALNVLDLLALLGVLVLIGAVIAGALVAAFVPIAVAGWVVAEALRGVVGAP